jgi:uncharacterized 2Fe-2S/4Fe-4S cluster protein (DUF4445 family)
MSNSSRCAAAANAAAAESAGNVAGEGAKMVLLSQPERNGASALLNEVEYVELSDRSDFNDKFVIQLGFPN